MLSILHIWFKLHNKSAIVKQLLIVYMNVLQNGVMDLQHIDPAFIRESVGSVGLSQTGNGTLTASVRDADEVFAGFSYAAPIDL